MRLVVTHIASHKRRAGTVFYATTVPAGIQYLQHGVLPSACFAPILPSSMAIFPHQYHADGPPAGRPTRAQQSPNQIWMPWNMFATLTATLYYTADMVDREGPTWERVCCSLRRSAAPDSNANWRGACAAPPPLRPFPCLRDSWEARRARGRGTAAARGGPRGTLGYVGSRGLGGNERLRAKWIPWLPITHGSSAVMEVKCGCDLCVCALHQDAHPALHTSQYRHSQRASLARDTQRKSGPG